MSFLYKLHSLPLHSHFVDLVLSENAQDARTVQACMVILMQHIGNICGRHVSVTFSSDNATNLNTQEHFDFVRAINLLGWGDEHLCKLTAWMFCEPQMGKSPVDIHFSYVGGVLSMSTCKQNVTTPEEVCDF